MKKALILSGGGARGAFQVGVWKYLREINWTPDLICGTSIGAVNAAAIGSGMSVERLIDVWRTHNRSAVYRLKAHHLFKSMRRGTPLKSVLDTAPLRAMLTRHLNLEALRRSPIEIIIGAVHLATGRLHLYNQDVIEIDHLMASSAMPILFPWQSIQGELYWDGGVMANSPLFIALERKIEEIVVVLLSPVGHRPLPPPATLREGLELLFEHFLIGSCQTTMPVFNGLPVHARDERSPNAPHAPQEMEGRRPPRISVVAPTEMLGFRSLLNFSARQVNRLIQAGYHNARRQLGKMD
ncbi:MAG: patatin-like phospholipase family protein [Desulfobacterales bacterium]|nr:patatin-like phospholipase family protein [Desulfobacterales bacterium]